MGKKLFDYVIGNPPYQEETLGDNKGFAPPVYDKFMDAAYEVADKVELIHPARFLFDAGSTPKAWNKKMLNDEHFKVLEYKADASSVFPGTDIKGGIAITYHDNMKDYGVIGIFTPYDNVNTIIQKLGQRLAAGAISDIGVSGYSYHFTDLLHKENPEILQTKIMIKGKESPLMSKGHEYDLKSNIITKLSMVFFDEKPDDGKEYLIIVGRDNNERVNKYIRRDYINDVSNLDKYKVFIPKASGIGSFGEPLGPSIIASPGMGHTETFFSIGAFDSRTEAENLLRYLKGKFARAMLSVLKKTQNITPGNFKYVPLQDFTPASDIDWSKSIHEIDLQLYRKYGLDEKEIEFIETHVKEMA